MPPQIIITDEEVRYAGQILLPNAEFFDEERVRFIKELTTVDMQACPGSGKTTCLFAKLLILAQHLPFEDGSGLLILSHTNAAVDEIKEKILKHCPHIFDHPNFIGTIQGFVDQFLAIPFYGQKYGHLPYRIDDEIFHEKVWEPGKARRWLQNKPNKNEIIENLRFDQGGNLVSVSALPGANTDTHKALLEMKNKLLSDGYLCFEDAFYLAECYIREFPKIIDLLQNRFAFVFIDEMQDADIRQLNLLDKLFPGNCQTTLQRIGDQNQAIYSRKVKSDNVWTPREGFLTLNGSKRLSENIAATVQNISLNVQELRGNSLRKNIKPKIILFDDATIKEVPKKFGDLIIANGLHQYERPVFKAIGWRKTPPENTAGLVLGSYFDGYQNPTYKSKLDFETLNGYLRAGDISDNESLASARRTILNAILKTLRITEVRQSIGFPFTVQALLAFLKNKNENIYDEFKLKLYKWSLAIHEGKDIHDEIRDYLKELLSNTFSLSETAIRKLEAFFSKPTEAGATASLQSKSLGNVFCYQLEDVKIDIHIATIHNAKGETHTATLYLETYYFNDAGKSYESQRLFEQLKGNRIAVSGVRVKESLKMAYVGMSRPTDLLCMAVHKSRMPDNEIVHFENNWEIISLCSERTEPILENVEER